MNKTLSIATMVGCILYALSYTEYQSWLALKKETNWILWPMQQLVNQIQAMKINPTLNQIDRKVELNQKAIHFQPQPVHLIKQIQLLQLAGQPTEYYEFRLNRMYHMTIQYKITTKE